MFGMNTPAYFCMDNFTTDEPLPASSLSVSNATTPTAKIYPNPATNRLYVDVTDNSVRQIAILDIAGRILNNYNVVPDGHNEINTSTLPVGVYMLKLSGDNNTVTTRFIKE